MTAEEKLPARVEALEGENAAYLWLHSQTDFKVNNYSGEGWLLFDERTGTERHATRINFSASEMRWPSPLEAIAKAQELARAGEG